VNQDAVRKRVVVHGRVQGVFFRDSTRERARSRGVAGWVSNRPDGAVEAIFEGEPEAVDSLVRFCQTGPRGADVNEVEVSDEEPEGLQGFEVR
jgi:acylphosphatase